MVPFVIRVTYFQVATEREKRLHVEDHETVAAGRALWEWLIRRSKIVHEHSLDQLVFFMFVPVQKFKEMEDFFLSCDISEDGDPPRAILHSLSLSARIV